MYGNINIIFIAQNKSYCLTNGYDFTLVLLQVMVFLVLLIISLSGLWYN